MLIFSSGGRGASSRGWTWRIESAGSRERWCDNNSRRRARMKGWFAQRRLYREGDCDMTVDELKKIVDACIKNAEGFIRAADALISANVPHVRYHLAALALEEIGKAFISNVHFVSSTNEDSTFYVNIPVDDHVKKLYWAFFGPLF